MLLRIVSVNRRLGIEIGEKVERASRPPRKQTLASSREKAEQICFGKTVQVDHEIKLTASHVFYDLKDSQNRQRFESVAQADAIHRNKRIGITRHPDYLCARSAYGHRDARMRKSLADRAQRRQAHDDVTELAEIDNQDVARVKAHRM